MFGLVKSLGVAALKKAVAHQAAKKTVEAILPNKMEYAIRRTRDLLAAAEALEDKVDDLPQDLQDLIAKAQTARRAWADAL